MDLNSREIRLSILLSLGARSNRLIAIIFIICSDHCREKVMRGRILLSSIDHESLFKRTCSILFERRFSIWKTCSISRRLSTFSKTISFCVYKWNEAQTEKRPISSARGRELEGTESNSYSLTAMDVAKKKREK